MANQFFLAPTANFVQTTISGAITASATTITLTSTTNLPSNGYIVVDRTDSNGNATPSAREVISYTGVSGSTITGATRGADGSTARSHADGAVVETMPTIGMWNNLATIVSSGFDTQGLLNAIASPVTITSMYLASAATTAAMFITKRLDVSAASITGVGLAPAFVGVGQFSGPTTAVGGILIAPRAATLQWISAITRFVVSGASVGFDFQVRGASVFANATTKPAIAAGGTYVSTASIATTNINPGDLMQANIDSVGTAGSVQVVTIQGGAL